MRVLMCGLATTKTEPPCPPSPPLGPPRGTNFSRRNAKQPRPPWPASTCMSTSSTKICLLQGKNADDAAARAVILESHASRGLGKNRVVFAETGVQPRAETAAALPHDDRAA